MDEKEYKNKSRVLMNVFMATVDTSNVKVADIIGLTRSAVSYLIKNGTFQLWRLIYILDYFGYELQIVKKKNE